MYDQQSNPVATFVFLLFFLFAGAASYAQAPIQDRSASAPTVEGARIGTNAARNAREAADRRNAEADSRHKAATARVKEAQAELEAANRERSEAAKQLEAARKAETDANTALDRALKK